MKNKEKTDERTSIIKVSFKTKLLVFYQGNGIIVFI